MIFYSAAPTIARKFRAYVQHLTHQHPSDNNDVSYRRSVELYLERAKGDVWTIETKENRQQDLPMFEPFKHELKKKIAIGAVSHRSLQADRPHEVAGEIRNALKYIPPERLVVSSDCGFGRQGCNREIAFYKASAIAQGCNIVRKELGFEEKYIPAADPRLQIDIKHSEREQRDYYAAS